MPTAAGYVLAFGVAGLAILADCHVVLARSLPRVPKFMFWHYGVVLLTGAGGAIAAVVYGLVDATKTDAFNSALSLRVAAPGLRGVVVGAMILVILRSKLFNVGDGGFGGEFVYTLLRSFAIQAVNDAHTVRRQVYLLNNLSAAAAIPNYFQMLDTQIAGSAKTLSAVNLGKLNSDIRTIKAKLARMPASQSGSAWNNLYLAYTGICYDYCGPHILDGFRNCQPARPGS